MKLVGNAIVTSVMCGDLPVVITLLLDSCSIVADQELPYLYHRLISRESRGASPRVRAQPEHPD